MNNYRVSSVNFTREAVAVEELFFSRNVTTAIAVGQARSGSAGRRRGGHPGVPVQAPGGQAGHRGLRKGRQGSGTADGTYAVEPGRDSPHRRC